MLTIQKGSHSAVAAEVRFRHELQSHYPRCRATRLTPSLAASDDSLGAIESALEIGRGDKSVVSIRRELGLKLVIHPDQPTLEFGPV
jgi:hypothetical protein